MRGLAVVVAMGLGSAAQADPCITVHAALPDDVATIRRVLVASLPETPGTCVDAAVESVVIDDSHGDVAVTASLRVAVSTARGQLACVLSGGATLHVARASYHPRRSGLYRRDVLEQATGGLVPALRARVQRTSE